MSYDEKSGAQSGWNSSVSGSNYHNHNYNDPAITQYTYDVLNAGKNAVGTPSASETALGQNAAIAGSLYAPQTRTATDASLYNASMGPTDQLTGKNTLVTPGQVGTTSLTNYFDPYTKNVTDVAVNDIDRSRQFANTEAKSNAAEIGGYGGARANLLEAENNRNAMDRTGAVSAQLNSANFLNAQQQAGADIDRSTAAQEFNNNQDLQRRTIDENANFTAAGIRQNAASALTQQAGQGTSLLQYMNGLPMAKASFLQSLLQGLPINKDVFGDAQSASNGFGGGSSSSSGFNVSLSQVMGMLGAI